MRCWPPFAVTVNGKPIEKYRFKKGRISYAPILGEYFAAHFWGCDLETWYYKSRGSRAAMIAAYKAQGMIEAADSQEANDEAERKAKTIKGKR